MPRSLADWLEFQSSIHPRTIELGLGRVREMLSRLRIERPVGPVLIVGGTNGKGSVAAFLEALLGHVGRRVGTYTSPHLIEYNERVRIGAKSIQTPALCEAFEVVEAARGDLELTFFEYGTLAALSAFAAARCDAWVLEVGLGGRLDAVNAIDGDASIVVSIGLDHTEWLGPDEESIGREKAGIFRAQRPAVLGSRQMPQTVAATARAIGAIPYALGAEFDALGHDEGGAGHWSFVCAGERREDLPPPALPGRVQRDNAATALATLAALGALPAHGTIARALQTVQLPGRFQRLVDGDRIEWVLDVAHNPPAAATLARNLEALPVAGRTYAAIGVLADKDASGIGRELAGRFAGYIAVDLHGERARAGDALAEALTPSLGAPLACVPSVQAALVKLRTLARGGDRIVVFGSFHVVGPALEWLRLYLKGWS